MDEGTAPAATYGTLLHRAEATLRAAGDATARLDAEVLLAHCLATSRAAVLAYPERAAPAKVTAQFLALVGRRAACEPTAYLTGHREFFGLDFATDARALVPRPETELLVEAALAELRARLADGERAPVVADIGTGSGAIAVALAVHEPRLQRLYATDLSPAALTLAQENAQRHGVGERVIFREGDLLTPLPEPVDVLLANLPYVAPRAAQSLPADVRAYEPALALYGAEDGLGHYRRFFAEAPRWLRPGGSIYVEFGYDQRAAVLALAHEAFPAATVRVHADYAGWDRFAVFHTLVPEAPRRR